MNLHQRNHSVVDDRELMRTVTANQLRAMGFDKIKATRNGSEALCMLLTAKFDAVLSDWNMPVMSGLDLLRAERAGTKLNKLPFLMITTTAERQRIEEVISADVIGLLVRPCNAGTLKAQQERILSVQPRLQPKPGATETLPASLARSAGTFEVVRVLREQPATDQLPVIFVTGLTDDEARLNADPSTAWQHQHADR